MAKVTGYQSFMRLEKARIDGRTAFEEGDFKAAVRHYTEAIVLSPDDASLYCDRSSAYASQKDFKRALTDARKAYEMKPLCPRSYLMLGLASLGLGLTKAATEYLSEGLIVYRDDLKLKAAFSRVSLETRESGYRTQNLPSALLMSPQSPYGPLSMQNQYPQPQHAASFPHSLEPIPPINQVHEDAVMRGNAALNEGDPCKALIYYTGGIAQSPNESNLYCCRSAAYAALGEFTLAHEDATRARELSPGSSVVYLRLGLAHLGLGRTDLALKALKHGLEIDPNDMPLTAACARANAEALKTVKMCRDIMAMGIISNPAAPKTTLDTAEIPHSPERLRARERLLAAKAMQEKMRADLNAQASKGGNREKNAKQEPKSLKLDDNFSAEEVKLRHRLIMQMKELHKKLHKKNEEKIIKLELESSKVDPNLGEKEKLEKENHEAEGSLISEPELKKDPSDANVHDEHAQASKETEIPNSMKQFLARQRLVVTETMKAHYRKAQANGDGNIENILTQEPKSPKLDDDFGGKQKAEKENRTDELPQTPQTEVSPISEPEKDHDTSQIVHDENAQAVKETEILQDQQVLKLSETPDHQIQENDEGDREQVLIHKLSEIPDPCIQENDQDWQFL